jgi:hypothetical protein
MKIGLVFVVSHRSDRFVKSSPAAGGTRRAKTEEGGALIAPQRFTLLDLFQNDFRPWRSAAVLAISKCEVSYLTGQGCRATPQMDFLRNHQDYSGRGQTARVTNSTSTPPVSFGWKNMAFSKVQVERGSPVTLRKPCSLRYFHPSSMFSTI